MNIVRELRKKKGIQQKELAIAIGVSNPTVSDWETGKKDPSGERLRKLAKYFEVDELTVLGTAVDLGSTYSDTPKTYEARLISGAIDKMPKEQRERALDIMRVVFAEYAAEFDKEGNETDET